MKICQSRKIRKLHQLPPPVPMTPVLKQEPHQIPYMNIMFFIPAAVGTLLGIFVVRNNLPPSPPSASEEQREEEESHTKK